MAVERVPWTERENAILVELWQNGSTVPEIAVVLNRSYRSVDARKEKLLRADVIDRHVFPSAPKRNKLLRLHAQGYDDFQLAQRLFIPLRYARSIRYGLGLKPNPPNGERKARAYRKRFAEAGPLWKLRKRKQEDEAFDLGWPIGCTRPMTNVLEALLYGWSTAFQVAHKVHRNPTCVRRLLHQACVKGWVTKTEQRRNVLWGLESTVWQKRMNVVSETGLQQGEAL